jgi:hypothetical protein
MAAIGGGMALGFTGSLASPWVGFALFLVVTVGLGVVAAKAKPQAAFWHGAALAWTAGALSGSVTLILLYNASPERQPSVLPPWPLFALAMLFMAIGAGALGGLAALVLAKKFGGPAKESQL